MRKYVIGMLVGGALTFAVQAGAATLLDSRVDAIINVEVDGQNLGQAPVIGGVSYLPVRKFGNEAGYKVSFGEGKATLTSGETTEPEVIVDPAPTPTPIPMETPTKTELQKVNDRIKELEGEYGKIKQEALLIFSKAEPGAEQKIKDLEAQGKPIQEELDALNKRKAELEAQ
jgi:hypothetical protein